MDGARGYIQLIATGGTISVGPESVLRAGSMIKMARRLPGDVPVRGNDFASVPSSCNTAADLCRLAARVNEALADSGCLGVVITHGTDSMEESAVALELLCKPNKPVALTGAMVPSKDSGADGPANVADAIEYVCSESGVGVGVVVVMNGRVHAALDVQKLHTSNKDAFGSGDAGPVGLISASNVEIVRQPIRLTIQTDTLDDSVELIKLATGCGAKLIEFSASGGARGIVIEAFGAGNLPAAIVEAAARARKLGSVVLVTSRVGTGPIFVNKAATKAGLLPAIIGGRRMTGQAARVLLMAMLGADMNESEISDLLAASNSPISG
jgi:L-asparaginase